MCVITPRGECAPARFHRHIVSGDPQSSREKLLQRARRIQLRYSSRTSNSSTDIRVFLESYNVRFVISFFVVVEEMIIFNDLRLKRRIPVKLDCNLWRLKFAGETRYIYIHIYVFTTLACISRRQRGSSPRVPPAILVTLCSGIVQGRG